MSTTILPLWTPPTTAPHVVGTTIYWTELIDPKGNKFTQQVRRAVALEQDDGGGVHVVMAAADDPLCRPEEEGRGLALALGTWRTAP